MTLRTATPHLLLVHLPNDRANHPWIRSVALAPLEMDLVLWSLHKLVVVLELAYDLLLVAVTRRWNGLFGSPLLLVVLIEVRHLDGL